MYIELDYKIITRVVARAFGDAHSIQRTADKWWKCGHCFAYGADMMTMDHNAGCDVPDLRRLVMDFALLEHDVYTLASKIDRGQIESASQDLVNSQSGESIQWTDLL